MGVRIPVDYYLLTEEEWEKIHSPENQDEFGRYKTHIGNIPKIAATQLMKEARVKGKAPYEIWHDDEQGQTLHNYHFETNSSTLSNLTAIIASTGVDPFGRIPFQEIHGFMIFFKNCSFCDGVLLTEIDFDTNKNSSSIISFKDCIFGKLAIQLAPLKGSALLIDCSIGVLEIMANQADGHLDLDSTIAANVGAKIRIIRGRVGNFEIKPYRNRVAVSSEIQVSDTDIEYFAIEAVKVISILSLDRCHIQKFARLHENANLSHYTTLMNSFFSTDKVNLPFFREVKEKMQQMGNSYEAHHFAAYELEAQKNFISNLRLRGVAQGQVKRNSSHDVEVALAAIYKIFSNFGRDLFSPLYWLLFLWIMGGLLLMGLDCFTISSEGAPKWAAQLLESGWGQVYFNMIYSLKLSFGPAGLFIPMQWVESKWAGAVLIAAFHQIIATCMWFVYLLQIKRRFSMG